jgi:L-ribulose-5-phosphate 3-epimerase
MIGNAAMSRFTIGTLESVLRSDWKDVFPRAASLGFDNVELGVRADDYRETDLWSPGGFGRLQERAKRSGIPIASICLHTFWKYTFADNDVSNRTTAKQILFHTYDACQALGASTILVPVTNPNKLSTEEAGKRWTEEVRAVAQGAESAGIRIALEVVGGSHAITGDEMKNLLEAVDSPAVGAYFDFGNSMMLGSDPVADIGILGESVFQVHVKDPKKDRIPCLLGEGDVDLSACLQALVKIDYTGPLVFETPPLDDARDTAAKNLAALKALIEKVEA